MRHRWQPDAVEHVVADVVVWATGMRPTRTDFLAPVAGRMEREGDEYKLDDHFAAVWDGPSGHHIFIQNAARQQRGLADPNLSLVAWRSQRIADRLRGVEPDRPTNSFIEWSAVMTETAGLIRGHEEQ
jgi:lysine N6-hydroxylase